MVHLTLLMMAIIIALVVNSVSAMPVTSIPGGTVVPMPVVNYKGTAPHSFGLGITWSSTTPDILLGSVFGWTSGYGYGSNGYWNGNIGPMAGLNYFDTRTMTFAFSTPIKGVGGFINYDRDPSNTPTKITVYDAGMNLIESETLTIVTDGSANSGEFHGFLETSPKISYFTLSNNAVGITKLTIDNGMSPAPVHSTPEFPSIFLPVSMIIGLLGAVLCIQRTREH